MAKPERRAFLFYGPPASGKSTVAREISSQLDLEYLSVGEITRSEIAKNTPIGQDFKKYLDVVVEYPVELITKVVEDRIIEAMDSGKGFILDGFPKYDWEAESFLELMKKHNFPLDKIIVVDVPLDVAISRVSNRRICSSCLSQFDISRNNLDKCANCGGKLIVREDDEPDILRRRYGDYEGSVSKTLKVLDKNYQGLIHIDGTKSREQVIQEVRSVLNKPE